MKLEPNIEPSSSPMIVNIQARTVPPHKEYAFGEEYLRD